jgi:hypothetical protein
LVIGGGSEHRKEKEASFHKTQSGREENREWKKKYKLCVDNPGVSGTSLTPGKVMVSSLGGLTANMKASFSCVTMFIL